MKVSKILISAAAVLAVSTAGYADYTPIDHFLDAGYEGSLGQVDENGDPITQMGLGHLINHEILEIENQADYVVGEQEPGVRISDDADGIWTIGGTAMTSNKMEFEFAGYRDNNEFGIYDLADPSTKVAIMDGSDGQGTQVSVTWDLINNRIVVADNTNLTMTAYDNTCFTTFGFYLDNKVDGGAFPYYSQAALNDQGYDHMVTYKGSNAFGQEDPADNSSPFLFGDGEYLVCWEDLKDRKSVG